MSDRYPNFRRAQRERGPFYKGPPIARARPIALGFVAAVLLVVAVGALLGWAW